MTPTILIVEDEQSIADVLSYALKSEGYATVHCTLASDALHHLRTHPPGLVILDIGLPDKSGFEVCREIRTFSSVPVLFLTSRVEEMDRIIGLEIGADDYVTKPFSPREVVARVRAILRRHTTTPTTRTAQWFKVDAAAARIYFCDTPLNLTRYEFLLLQHLLQQPGRIYSRELLMDAIWKDALDTADRTVDTHIKTLRAKLKAAREELDPIQTHRGMGYSIANGSQP